jgi:hypothetical protein
MALRRRGGGERVCRRQGRIDPARRAAPFSAQRRLGGENSEFDAYCDTTGYPDRGGRQGGPASSWPRRRGRGRASLYTPVREALEAKAESHRDVAGGVDDGPTGWADVDANMGALRGRAGEAEDTDDFKAVGLQCVSVLEARGRAASTRRGTFPRASTFRTPTTPRRGWGTS